MHTLLRYFLVLFSASILSANSFATSLLDDPDNPIRLFALFHDDVPEHKKNSIYGAQIRPFIDEFEKITNRKIRVIYDERRPPYTNFNYHSEDHNKMFEDWKSLAWQYKIERHEKNEFHFSRNDRILLITDTFINGTPILGGVAGLASRPGYSAIASLHYGQTIGHELGHTFNAVHEHSEVFYNGWWCETFMTPTPLILRSNCLVFSEANQNRIKTYVDSLY